MRSVMNSMRLFIVLLVKDLMQTRFTLRCIQSAEKCSFISLLAPYPFNKYKFLIKILASSIKVILFLYITTVICQGAWVPCKPCSWYWTRTKLFELNQSATKWRCLVWKIIMGELILMNLCRPALGMQFFRHSVELMFTEYGKVKCSLATFCDFLYAAAFLPSETRHAQSWLLKFCLSDACICSRMKESTIDILISIHLVFTKPTVLVGTPFCTEKFGQNPSFSKMQTLKDFCF